MKNFLQKHRQLVGISGTVVALGVALMYLKIVPEQATTASGFQKIILMYGHSVCWLLLSAAAFFWGTNKSKLSATLAYVALIAYACFIFTLITI